MLTLFPWPNRASLYAARSRLRASFPLLGALLTSLMLLVPLPALAAGGTRTVVDMAGRSVEIPLHIGRVYAVGHCVPLVGALAPDQLANTMRLSEASKQLLSPRLYENKVAPASGLRLSDEELVKLAPDLIVMETMAGAEDAAARLQARLKAPVVLVDQDMGRYREAFDFLGDVLGQRNQAESLKDFVATYLEPIREKARLIPEAERVRVYYAENPNGLATNPSGNAHAQVLDIVGARNVAQVGNSPDEAMALVSMEQLLIWQPARILVWTPGADDLVTYRAITQGPLWQQLEAVKHQQVIQIPWQPFSWFDRPPGTNRIIGAIWLANLLYPERFPVDMVKVTQEYFRRFYHREPTAAQVRKLLGNIHPAG